MAPLHDRRRQVADDLYDALVKQGASFWEHVYPMFLARDITRHDLRQLVRRGLRESRGRYKSLLKLFGMPSRDYRRFMNFLAAHDCGVEFREFRGGRLRQLVRAEPPLYPVRARMSVERHREHSRGSVGRPLNAQPPHLRLQGRAPEPEPRRGAGRPGDDAARFPQGAQESLRVRRR